MEEHIDKAQWSVFCTDLAKTHHGYEARLHVHRTPQSNVSSILIVSADKTETPVHLRPQSRLTA